MQTRDPSPAAPSAACPAGIDARRAVRPGASRGFIVRPLTSVLLALGTMSFAACSGAAVTTSAGTELAATTSASAEASGSPAPRSPTAGGGTLVAVA